VTDGPSAPLRALHTSRVGFGVTTAALVALASSGTGLLVSHANKQLQPATPHALPPLAPSPPAAPVLVDRAPGSLVLPSPLVDGTARAIHRALVSAPRQTRRTITGPLVPVSPPEVVVVPPVVVPPVAPPPVVPPPVLGPSVDPGGKPGKHDKKPHPAHPDDHGKHLGQLKH